ncbi:MAG TPA: TolC family outer membrane protein [Burkholderiaceae bacterium]|nr:TolC family outer membrane protein [Burkholderiaceae bacterium]
MTPTVRSIALAAVWALLPAIVAAQADDPMAKAARRALETNPDVTARVNALRASLDAVSVARAGWLPRVDAEAGAGRTEDRITSRTPANGSLDHNGVALSITQLLWDGTALTTQIRRLDHDRQTRWFELLDVSENTALEAARAYIDVVRYRKMVALSEDNYVDHRFYYQQIDSRFRAGVGRGVDVEQAAARVALAESNLTTDISNLHDVVARYLRIVGEAPMQQPPRPQSFAAGLPTTATQAMDVALRNSAAINAAIESLRSARAAVGERESAFWPKVEARVRAGGGHNFDATPDLKRDVTAGVVLNWNLFAGGADQARVRQQTNLLNQAADLRDKACRDTRQNASIAYNDVIKLEDQLRVLDRNVLAIEKTRDAYRQQFNIGQRSLLDLLNSENELYTARRSYTTADYDRLFAQARLLASMQQLTQRLGLRAPVSAADAGSDGNWSAGDDTPQRCPVMVADVVTTPLSELDQRAQRMHESVPRPAR